MRNLYRSHGILLIKTETDSRIVLPIFWLHIMNLARSNDNSQPTYHVVDDGNFVVYDGSFLLTNPK